MTDPPGLALVRFTLVARGTRLLDLGQPVHTHHLGTSF